MIFAIKYVLYLIASFNLLFWFISTADMYHWSIIKIVYVIIEITLILSLYGVYRKNKWGQILIILYFFVMMYFIIERIMANGMSSYKCLGIIVISAPVFIVLIDLTAYLRAYRKSLVR